MRPLYRARQRDTCTVRSQPVYMVKPLKISSPKNMALKQHFIKSILDSYTISFVQMIGSEIDLDIFTQLEIVEILVPEFLVLTDTSERLQI